MSCDSGRCEKCGKPWRVSWDARSPYCYTCRAEDFIKASRKTEDFVRANGALYCKECGKQYREHPFDELKPYLNVLCDGTRVKL